LQCIESIHNTVHIRDYVVTVVDNNSTDGSVEAIKNKFPQTNLICNQDNYGYAKAVNIGVNSIQSEYVIISNSDVIYLENSIKFLLDGLNEERFGILGPTQYFPNGNYQFLMQILPGYKLILVNYFMLTIPIKIINRLLNALGINPSKKRSDYIDGAVIAVKKQLFDAVDGFDEDYFFYTEEADFAYKLSEQGYKHYVLRKSEVIHHRGASGENSGVNPKSIEMLINTKMVFCRKHLSEKCTKWYIRSELFYTRILLNLWKVIYHLRPKQNSLDKKIKFLEITIDNWKKRLKANIRGKV
jgi:GT2 family glycosyltransferase